MNIANNSKFNINIDFKKSERLYLFDRNTNRRYLDFFGMYASLPLGYNHNIFESDKFRDEMLGASKVKINNCEFFSNESIEFDKKFMDYANKDNFSNFHYTCTGALAVEAAIKTALHATGYRPLNVLSFRNSFHGVNSYGSFITDRFWPVNAKLDQLPDIFSTKIDLDLSIMEYHLKKNNITCVIIEPIQCSAGDIYHDLSFFEGARSLCDQYNIPLIFDEIQVGFGGTGKLWFYQHTKIIPDIVIYGKKTQLSGIMVNEKYSQIFDSKNITRLQVTWDGNLLDMIRCKYIIEAYEKYNILQNVKNRSSSFLRMLKGLKNIQNPRSCGLIAAFDMENTKQRDNLVKELYNNGMIVNKTGNRSIRLRPALTISENDIKAATEIFNKSIKIINNRG
tara:strand:- start:3082 stop:4263 length:1182 start_codon:yes stop_codon:yes gene_type:complete